MEGVWGVNLPSESSFGRKLLQNIIRNLWSCSEPESGSNESSGRTTTAKLHGILIRSHWKYSRTPKRPGQIKKMPKSGVQLFSKWPFAALNRSSTGPQQVLKRMLNRSSTGPRKVLSYGAGLARRCGPESYQ